MKRKRDIRIQKIIKYKARLNVHGGQQEYVVNWFLVRLLLVLTLLLNWHTRQIDFVLAYSQAPIKCDLFMKMPRGIVVPGYDPKQYCLRLVKNIYGQKQAGRAWNKYLCEGPTKLSFSQSTVDECVWYK